MKTIQLRKLLILVGLTLLLTASLGGIVSAAPLPAPALQADEDAGVLILAVRDNSPADKAGLVRGDIVLAVDDETVDTAQDLAAVIQEFEVGDEITVSVLHGDEIVERTVILGERNNRTYLGVQPYVATDGEATGADDENADNPEEIEGGEAEADEAGTDNQADDEAENESPDADNAGVEEQENPMTDLFGLLPADLTGAIVAEVVAASPADEAGLAAGDVIVAVDGEAVTTESDLATLIAAFTPGDEVTLDVLANGVQDDETAEVAVTLGAHPEDEERAYLGVAYMLAPAMMDDLGELPFAPRGTSPDDGEKDGNSEETLEDENATPDDMMPEDRLKQLFGMGALGAIIGDVLEESPAAIAGLASGDVILAVDGEKISPEADLATLIGNYEPGDEVTLEMRAPDAEEGDTFKVVVTLGAHPDDEDRAFLGISYMPAPMMFDRDGMQLDDMLPFMPRFRDMPRQEDDEGQRERHDYHRDYHRDYHHDYHHRDHHQDEGESCNDECPHGSESGSHEDMMMPFHNFFGFEDFDLDSLSEDELEMLQEIFPFLFSDEAVPEGDGEL